MPKGLLDLIPVLNGSNYPAWYPNMEAYIQSQGLGLTLTKTESEYRGEGKADQLLSFRRYWTPT